MEGDGMFFDVLRFSTQAPKSLIALTIVDGRLSFAGAKVLSLLNFPSGWRPFNDVENIFLDRPEIIFQFLRKLIYGLFYFWVCDEGESG